MSAVPTSTIAASSRKPGSGTRTCWTATAGGAGWVAADVSSCMAGWAASGAAAATHPANTRETTYLRITVDLDFPTTFTDEHGRTPLLVSARAIRGHGVRPVDESPTGLKRLIRSGRCTPAADAVTRAKVQGLCHNRAEPNTRFSRAIRAADVESGSLLPTL